MPFVPRAATEIAQSLLAKALARSPLTDVNEGSVVWMLCQSLAEELADAEYRLFQVRRSFSLTNEGISQADLDERLKEFPPGSVSRIVASSASGAVMTVSRQQDQTKQTLPAGSTFKRADNNLLYRTVADVVFEIGTQTFTDVFVVCTSPGTQGNTGAGTITQSVGAPSWILSSINTKPLTNGVDAEPDDAVRHRALLWLAGLPRAQKQALEFLALSFSSIDGTKAKFAKVFEDLSAPGYAELIVDDGSGFPALFAHVDMYPFFTVPAPKGGQTVFYHPGPASEPFSEFLVKKISGQTMHLLPGQFKHLPERGIVEIPANQTWSVNEGDTWSTPHYKQFVGYLSELQRQIEGDVNDPTNAPGWRAAGIRVAVRPPTVFYSTMVLHVVPADGVDLGGLQLRVFDYVVAFCDSLGPGEPLFVSALVASVMQDVNVVNFRVFEPGAQGVAPQQKGDVYVTPKQVIRTGLSYLSFLGS